VILNGHDVEHPNPNSPDVEIATLNLTLVTLDGTRSDFSVQLGFEAPSNRDVTPSPDRDTV